MDAAGGNAVPVFASVADEAGANEIVQTALDTFGRFDILVNNAGIVDPYHFADLTMVHYRRMVDAHYLGTVQVTMAAWPHLRKAPHRGVVNTASEGIFGNIPKCTSYAGAKGGVFAFTRASGVRAAAVGHPGECRRARGERLECQMRQCFPESSTSQRKCFTTFPGQPETRICLSGGRLSRARVMFSQRRNPGLRGRAGHAIGDNRNQGRLPTKRSAPEFIAQNIDEILDTTDALVLRRRVAILRHPKNFRRAAATLAGSRGGVEFVPRNTLAACILTTTGPCQPGIPWWSHQEEEGWARRCLQS